MLVPFLDVAVRGACTGIVLVLCTLILWSRASREAQWALLALSISAMVRLWANSAPSLDALDPWRMTMRYVGVIGPFAVTWFIICIFMDDRRWAWVLFLSAAILSVGLIFTPMFDALRLYLRVFAVGHFVALLAMILISGYGDLQAARRQLRPVMTAFVVLYCVSLALFSSPMYGAVSDGRALMQSSLFLLFMMTFALWALKANLAAWPGKVEPRSPSQPTASEVSLEQRALVRKIDHAMQDGIWRVEGLTVGALATKVGAPEHQVRKAINQVLGHRNFASFINRARIEAAKSRLAQPDAVDLTILEVAFDVGFSSLGPFNRAFRSETGQSPTDFRKEALSDALGPALA